jgi:hypothetical protein
MNPTIIKECKHHGKTEHSQETRGYYRCKKCRVNAVAKRRRKTKEKAVEYKDSKCFDCGLETEYIEVYEFHHLDPSKKDFAIGHKGHTRSWQKTKLELDKCVMLCANCHRIRHAKHNAPIAQLDRAIDF